MTDDDSDDRNDRSETPQADIDREWRKAEQMFSDARKANEVDISKATTVNRLYYACFHAAQAALYARGWNPQSHGHVQTLLGRELVQRGDLSREFGRFFDDMGSISDASSMALAASDGRRRISSNGRQSS